MKTLTAIFIAVLLSATVATASEYQYDYLGKSKDGENIYLERTHTQCDDRYCAGPVLFIGENKDSMTLIGIDCKEMRFSVLYHTTYTKDQSVRLNRYNGMRGNTVTTKRIPMGSVAAKMYEMVCE
jgi:hypothetical protein